MIEDKIAEILDEYQYVGTIHPDDVINSEVEYSDDYIEFLPAKPDAPYMVFDEQIEWKTAKPSYGGIGLTASEVISYPYADYKQKWIVGAETGKYASGGILEPPPIPAHKCPHGCNRDRHAEPLTGVVAAFYDNHHFDSSYSPDDDESEIVCVGASYMGPNRPPPHRHIHTAVGNWTVVVGGKTPSYCPGLSDLYGKLANYFAEINSMWQIPNVHMKLWDSEFNMIAASKPDLSDLPDIEVKWGQPAPVTKTAYTIDALQAMKSIAPEKFAPTTPVPASPGYDFNHIDLEPKWVGVK